MWIQKHSTAVMTAGKSQKTVQRMQQITDAENRKLCFEGCNHPVPKPAFVRDKSVEAVMTKLLHCFHVCVLC